MRFEAYINSRPRKALWRLPASAVALLLAAAPALAQPLPMGVVRVAAPVELRRGDKITELRGPTALQANDRIITAPQGRAAMQLAGGGTLRLGGDSSLHVHSADAPQPGNGGVARLVLERGSLRLDARSRAGQLPQDYRLNVGRLRLRVFGGEAWTEIGARGENVCLLSGAVEIVRDDGSGERLDQPGSCLLFGAGGRLAVQGDGGEALARKLLRTAFADDLDARMAADQTPTPAAPVLPPAAATDPAPAAVEPAVASGPRWTLVLASFPDPASAESATRRWLTLGEQPQVRRSDTPSGLRFRLTVGDYASLAEARSALSALRSRQLEAAEAWVMPVKD